MKKFILFNNDPLTDEKIALITCDQFIIEGYKRYLNFAKAAELTDTFLLALNSRATNIEYYPGKNYEIIYKRLTRIEVNSLAELKSYQFN
jgi:hypothetical protein